MVFSAQMIETVAFGDTLTVNCQLSIVNYLYAAGLSEDLLF